MEKKIKITLTPSKVRDTFIRDLRHTHISYVGKNGKAYTRKKKYKENYLTY